MNFFGVGVQQRQLRLEGRENGDVGAVAPKSRVPLNLQMNETHILIRLLQMYIPRNWEFSSALAKTSEFREVEPPNGAFGKPLTFVTFTQNFCLTEYFVKS
jgi:hypothetical protein